MSDYIPWEIQSQIIKSLPVKSLFQFRSVSKQWKSFIDCPEFIKNYNINHPNPQHHLLVEYTNPVPRYTSIVDDNTFPLNKFDLTAPKLHDSLRGTTILGSVGGLICFYGLYEHRPFEYTSMVVLWNPSIRKCVGIHIPNVLAGPYEGTRIGFGVCPDTNDPKLVKINVVYMPRFYWEVEVFTLSSRVWKTVYRGAPYKACFLLRGHVFIDGFIYWRTSGQFLISFDLKSYKFGEVCLPKRFTSACDMRLAKVNGSLGFFRYHKKVCCVWMRKDGVNKPFTKIYTIKVEGKSVVDTILGFRKNGKAVMEMKGKGSCIEVYEPSSGRINSVRMSGDCNKFYSVRSYMETLLLLDESNSIIR